jgi:RimJ/RimL family protein N-acetyltransferase
MMGVVMSKIAKTQPILTDGVVWLNQYTLADVPAHLAGEDEEHARRFGWYPARSTEATVRAWIERQIESWRSEGPTRAFAARLVASGELVGGCELRLEGNGVAHASYWTAPPFRGRGLATRALRLAGAYAAESLGVRRLELEIAPDNLASRRVAQGAGFTGVGEFFPDEAARLANQPMVRYVRQIDPGE